MLDYFSKAILLRSYYSNATFYLIISGDEMFSTSRFVEHRIHGYGFNRPIKINDLIVFGVVQSIDNNL